MVYDDDPSVLKLSRACDRISRMDFPIFPSHLDCRIYPRSLSSGLSTLSFYVCQLYGHCLVSHQNLKIWDTKLLRWVYVGNGFAAIGKKRYHWYCWEIRTVRLRLDIIVVYFKYVFLIYFNSNLYPTVSMHQQQHQRDSPPQRIICMGNWAWPLSSLWLSFYAWMAG